MVIEPVVSLRPEAVWSPWEMRIGARTMPTMLGRCEGVGRPNTRSVAIKSEEQQTVLLVHRARALTVPSPSHFT